MDISKLDSQSIKTLNSQNIYESKYNNYKSLPIYKFVKNNFLNEYNPGNISNICDLKIINSHPIDILDELLQKGQNNLLSQNIPLVVQCIGKEYKGDNPELFDGIRDLTYIIRTNISSIFKLGNCFPIEDKECIYTKLITTIRDKNGQFLSHDKLYGFSLLSVSPIEQPELNNEYKMNSNDYIKTLSVIESIFQTAIASNNKIIILPLFGQHEKDANPIQDILMIYNYCILKYSHKFTNIIISIPEEMVEDYSSIVNETIINPIELTKSIDDKFDSKKMQHILLSK